MLPAVTFLRDHTVICEKSAVNVFSVIIRHAMKGVIVDWCFMIQVFVFCFVQFIEAVARR